MEIPVKFELILVDGTEEEQVLKCGQPDLLEQFVMQAMAQFSQLGMLRKPDSATYFLIPHAQIARVRATVPAITLASPSDLSQAAAQAESIKKITLG